MERVYHLVGGKKRLWVLVSEYKGLLASKG